MIKSKHNVINSTINGIKRIQQRNAINSTTVLHYNSIK